MSNDAITYKQLEDVLVYLGFSGRRVEPKWLRYEHPASDTVIVLVDKKANEWVRATDALSAQRHLVEKGLISEEELDTILSRKATVK
jgi:hypothetical protein